MKIIITISIIFALSAYCSTYEGSSDEVKVYALKIIRPGLPPLGRVRVLVAGQLFKQWDHSSFLVAERDVRAINKRLSGHISLNLEDFDPIFPERMLPALD